MARFVHAKTVSMAMEHVEALAQSTRAIMDEVAEEDPNSPRMPPPTWSSSGIPSDVRADDAHMLRLTVPEATRLLGISAEVVRSRIQRGSPDGMKEASTVYVLLDTH